MGKETSVRITLAALALAVAGCEASTPQPPDHSVTPAALTHTWTPEPSATPTSTESPTPEPSATPPAVDHGLGAQYEATWDSEQGAWVAQSRDGIVGAQWNPEINTWERILGGDQVGEAFYYFDGAHTVASVPPELRQYIVPVSAEEWARRERLTDTDGNPLPDGQVFSIVGASGSNARVFSGWLSAVVWYEKGERRGYPGKVYFAVVQFPARGGTNTVFYQLNEGYKGADRAFYTLPEGLPAEWVGRQVTTQEIRTQLPRETYDVVSHRDLIPILQQHIGRPILVEVMYGSDPGPLLDDLAAQRLIPENTEYRYGWDGFWVPPVTP